MSRASVTWVAAVLIAIPWMARAAGPWPAEGSVEVFFTPWDDAEGALLRAVRQAKRSVRVQAYLLTSRPVTDALLAAHARGVKVELLADAENVRRGNGRQGPLIHIMRVIHRCNLIQGGNIVIRFTGSHRCGFRQRSLSHFFRHIDHNGVE